MIVAVRAILVTTRIQTSGESDTCLTNPPVFKFSDIFSKAFFAFLASKGLFLGLESGSTWQALAITTMSNFCSN